MTDATALAAAIADGARTIGLAGGGTPEATYRLLADRAADDPPGQVLALGFELGGHAPGAQPGGVFAREGEGLVHVGDQVHRRALPPARMRR